MHSFLPKNQPRVFCFIFKASQNGDGDNDADYSESIEIEPSKVGRVVGSKGSTINQLQTDFNVKIDIDKEDNLVILEG